MNLCLGEKALNSYDFQNTDYVGKVAASNSVIGWKQQQKYWTLLLVENMRIKSLNCKNSAEKTNERKREFIRFFIARFLNHKQIFYFLQRDTARQKNPISKHSICNQHLRRCKLWCAVVDDLFLFHQNCLWCNISKS